METFQRTADNPKMDDTLFDQAVELAYQTFAEVSDEHVMGLYSQLIWNYQRGLGDAGVGTVH